MNDIDVFRLISGVLQLGVAWYVLRLGRLFKSTFVGWLLFGALTIMALLNSAYAVVPLGAAAQWGIQVSLLYTMLLLVGLARFYSGLQTFLRQDATERRALDDWELQVKEQWVELNKANERLRETVSKREAEIAERKQGQEQLEKKMKELKAAARHLEATVRQLEEEVRQREQALTPPEPVAPLTPPTPPPVEPIVPPTAQTAPAVEPVWASNGQTTTSAEPAVPSAAEPAPAVAPAVPAVELTAPTAEPAVPAAEPVVASIEESEPTAPAVEPTVVPGGQNAGSGQIQPPEF